MRKLPHIRHGGRARPGSHRWLAWLATWLADRRRARQAAGSGMPVPNAPTNLAVSAEDRFFILTWEDHSTNEAGFRVCRKEFSGAYHFQDELPPNTTACGDFDIEPGIYYTWRMVAFNAGGASAWSNEASGEILGA